MPSTTDTTTAKISSLTTDLFYDAMKNYIDYYKPDPIAQRQLESWKMNWSEGSDGQNVAAADGNSSSDDDNENNSGNGVDWRPTNGIKGALEICGDYVAVTIKMSCSWTDGDGDDSKTEDGRLSYTCRVASARLIEKMKDEEKNERKIRKKMVSRLRQDSYIAKLLALEEQKKSTTLCLAQANIYVNAAKFELEERVDVSETVAEALRRALWSSTKSSLDVVEVILALPSLPCRTTGTKTTTRTTRLANRAKLRLLEDAMLDECEKEGDDQLIEDLNISKSGPEDCQKEEKNDAPTRKKKKSKR